MIQRRFHLTSTERKKTEATPPSGDSASRLARLSWRLLGGVWFFVRLAVCVWATLALYYSNLPWSGLRLALAVAFGLFGVWALWLSQNRRTRWAFAGCFLGVLVWFASIPPSHDRPWRAEVAVMPRAEIDGDRVRLTGVRDFDYRSRDDFTVRYIEREVLLSHLTSVDVYIAYWKVRLVGHTFVSFVFDNAPPICISIETRPEVGENYSPLGSLFKQFELIYVVGEERDLVRSRTNYRKEEVFLYRIQLSPQAARRLFQVYLERINQLADTPEWYHLLKNNCTLNIVRYRNATGRVDGFDFRHVLNGWIDQYLYDTDMVDTSLPFEELRRRSRINDVAQAADDESDFPTRIRDSLPRVKSE